MQKIAYIKDVGILKDVPCEVVSVILESVTILDETYGEDRAVDSDDGGYVLILEAEEDIELAEVLIGEKLNEALFEYEDEIICDNGETYTSSLFLMSNDFGIVIVSPFGSKKAEIFTAKVSMVAVEAVVSAVRTVCAECFEKISLQNVNSAENAGICESENEEEN